MRDKRWCENISKGKKGKSNGLLGYKQTDVHKKNMSKAMKGKHTSPATQFKKGHIGYKGGYIDGRTPEMELLRHSLEYTIWRNEVYKRDNWTCRICGKKCKAKDIIAHHLQLFSEFPELRFVVDNGITLCRSCHLKLHKQLKNNIKN